MFKTYLFVVMFFSTHMFYAIQAQNPAAGADNFGVYTLEDGHVLGQESEGPWAVGGDLHLDGNTYNMFGGINTYNSDSQPTALIVDGRIFYNNQNATLRVLNQNYVKIGDLTGSTVYTTDQNNAQVNTRITNGDFNGRRIELNTMQSAASIAQDPGLDFVAAFNDFRSSSDCIEMYTANVPVNLVLGVHQLTLTANQTNVLNLTVTEFEAMNLIQFVGGVVPTLTSPFVVNITDAGVFTMQDWGNIQDTPLDYADYILFNFPNATQITNTGSGNVYGTIFAPYGHFIDNNNSNLDGQVIAQEFTHNGGELHPITFKATLVLCSCTTDVDQDGVCADVDCDDNNASIGSNVNDADCDGVPTSEDCNDNDASNTNSNVNDADCDGVPTSEDCNDNDASITNSNVNDADCDGVPTSEDCDDNDASVTTTNVNDADCDGVPTSEDCDDNDPLNTNSNVGDPDCDGIPGDACTDGATVGVVTANDPDADGINNVCDLDDDNDGILDINEGYCTGDNPISQDDWSLLAVSSDQASAGEGAANAFDGDNSTIWHTQYDPSTPTHPHNIDINLGGSYNLRSFSYQPRPSTSVNGRIAGYEFYTSIDGTTWTQVASGTFPNSASLQTVAFSTSFAKYVRLVATSSHNSDPWASVGEINLTGCATLDTDNDGTPNHLDLDSDGDGCFDALEADGGFVAGDLNANGSINSSVNGSGVPASTGSGISPQVDTNDATGNSTNSSITSPNCDDDGDGVINSADVCPGSDDTANIDMDATPDGCDLDNDNDGILDAVECPLTTTSNVDPGCTATAYQLVSTSSYGTSGGLSSLVSAGTNLDIAIGEIGVYVMEKTSDNSQYYLALKPISTNSTPAADLLELDVSNGGLPQIEFSGTTATPGQENVAFEFAFYDINDTDFSAVTTVVEAAEAILAGGGTLVNDCFGIEIADVDGGGTSNRQEGVAGDVTTLLSLITETPNSYTQSYELPLLRLDGTVNNPADVVQLYYSGATNTILFYNDMDDDAAYNLDFSFPASFTNASTATVGCDTDKDGIPNYLDLDSDGDGCFDALEGSSNFVFGDLDGGEINSTIGSNGVPGNTGAGTSPQDVGTSADEDQVGAACLPVATANQSLSNPPGAVTQQIVSENDVDGIDNDPDGTLDLSSIDLNPGMAGQQTSLTVPTEGIWTVNTSNGEVTFTPCVASGDPAGCTAGFLGDPTDIMYTINDNDGNTSNIDAIKVDYVPIATNDTDTYNEGTAKTVNPLINDNTGDTAEPSTVTLDNTSITGGICTTGTSPNCTAVTVPTEGVWTVNTSTGEVTFTPCVASGNPAGCTAGFNGSPTPITYSVEDNDGNATSATITLTVVLPIDLVRFTAVRDGKQGRLTWATASEINNDRFEIERSIDGGHFEMIGSQKGAGTTSEKQDYEYIDQRPTDGVNYYRLKQVDFDGKSEYSVIRTIDFGGSTADAGFTYYPNPVRDQLSILDRGAITNYQIQILDVTGKMVFSSNYSSGMIVNTQDFHSGIYMVLILDSQLQIVNAHKVIKQ